MARPKSISKKERINLTVSKEVKQMADIIRQYSEESISEILEDAIRKKYKKIQKNLKDVPEPQIPGQTEFEELGSILNSIDFEV